MSAPEHGADGAHSGDGRWGDAHQGDGHSGDGHWDHGHRGGPFPRRGPSRWARLWIPVIVSFVVQVPGALFTWPNWGAGVAAEHRPTLRPDAAAAVPLALVGPIALIGARRFPGPVVAVVAAAAVADLFLTTGAPGPPYIALAFAIVSAIVRGARLWGWASVGAVWLGLLIAALTLGPILSPGRIAFTTFGLLAMLGIGEAVRARRERIAAFRRASLQRRQTAAEAERVRIARELHDVLAHSLSSINVQAGVGLHLMERDPAKAAEALAVIKATSKTALDEVRSVLGVLRSDGSAEGAPLVPEPDRSQLESLTRSVSAQGLDVSLEIATELVAAEVPRQIQLALYRIVQESLTNVVRHAGATRVTVTVREEGGDYVAEIVDNGRGAQAETEAADAGRGILGMRERAELLGGTMEAGPRPGGGFRVLARIPAPRSEPTA
jgi:signal transduction histidine kinase